MEIADDFCDGSYWTHQLSDHTSDECLSWQHGVYEFAKFLDAVGIGITENTQLYEQLWKDIRTHKPTGIKTHSDKEVKDG